MKNGCGGVLTIGAGECEEWVRGSVRMGMGECKNGCGGV